MLSVPTAILLDPANKDRCQALATQLGAELITTVDDICHRFLVGFDDQRQLTLTDRQSPELQPLTIELGGRSQGKGPDPLLRAIGGKTQMVVDCTAGLGRDAAHIAARLCRVIAIEQNPLIYCLLEDALDRCQWPVIRDRLSLIYGDSFEWLKQLESPIDVVYLDPMYPPRPGTAAVKKELQILQQLTAPDPQSDANLLALARRLAKSRVVVKRPHYAPPLAEGSSGATRGKLVRFDIYPPLR